MTQLLHWIRQLLALTMILFFMAWMWAVGAQWVLRWRAQRLLADVRTLEVGTPPADAVNHFLGRWKVAGNAECKPRSCFYAVVLETTLPSWARYDATRSGLRNLIPHAAVDLGLRSSLVRGGFAIEDGVVARVYFGEGVEGESSVHGQSREIFAGSQEIAGYAPQGAQTLLPLPDHRRVLSTKMGLLVEFDPALDPSAKRAAMNFRLACITQFKPCLREEEILPGAGKLLEKRKPAGAP
ncbi:hypothetical protein [Granulicella rosea]|uniref:hypothetical protein n=1 Tax=Granulicella rosea TaxID=474952 RepID=UPI000B76C859|nr:hypothetical protein [Granulicella rosea]